MVLTVQPKFPQLSDQAEGLLSRVLLGAPGKLDAALRLCVFKLDGKWFSFKY